MFMGWGIWPLLWTYSTFANHFHADRNAFCQVYSNHGVVSPRYCLSILYRLAVLQKNHWATQKGSQTSQPTTGGLGWIAMLRRHIPKSLAGFQVPSRCHPWRLMAGIIWFDESPRLHNMWGPQKRNRVQLGWTNNSNVTFWFMVCK